MKKNKSTLLLLVRRVHMFLALFLTPWVLMYAFSTLAMHHRMLLTGHEQRIHPGYDLVREESYTPHLDEGQDRWIVARNILSDLNLDGAFSVNGNLEDGRLTINRDHPVRSYLITYETALNTIRVERQKFGMHFFLEMLHRRRGFQHPYFSNDLWAIVVDGVIFAIQLWAVTGLWMWWSMTRTRKMGAVFLGVGVVLFGLFLLIL